MKFLKNEKGAVPIIEASFLFPIVFLVVFLLIYMGLYMLQSVIMYTQAQKIATVASKELSLPGYEIIGNQSARTNAVDFADSSLFTENNVRSIYDSDSKLYRYLQFGDPLADNESELESALETLVGNTNILSPSTIQCNIEAKNYFITQEVKVEITKKVNIPELFNYLGVGNQSADITVTALAASSDGAEFVRNTDLVYDFVTFLSDKLHISDKISTMTQKIKDTMNSLK